MNSRWGRMLFWGGFAVCCMVAGVLQGASREFSQVRPGYEFSFPRDHFSHDDYVIEWWYFTGNVTDGARWFGYELTFFRYGLDDPAVVGNPSAWAPRDLFLAHFAVSDLENAAFWYTERMNRSALNRAGASAEAGKVYNGSWEWIPGDPWRLRAEEGDHALDLELAPLKPPVLHGDHGFAPKAENQAEASYYYSFTRLKTQGILRVRNEMFSVRGWSWMDHEFTSGRLDPADKEGWDWFSIQLDNDTELMLYLLRHTDSSREAFGLGTLVHPDGSWVPLPRESFEIFPRSHWESRETGARYPVSWLIRIPEFQAELQVEAAFHAQELVTTRSTGITYWEGSVLVDGRLYDQPVRGRGYTEMTGYAGPMRLEVRRAHDAKDSGNEAETRP